MFALYGLEDIARSVARTNPDGSKGTKIYKSYKSKIKNAGLSGTFNSVKKELGAPDTLFAMMMKPAEEWDAENIGANDITKGLSEATLSNIGKAFTMARGAIPKSLWDCSVLGEVASTKVPVEPVKQAQNGVKPVMVQNPGVPRALKGDLHRPKRNVKKRTYGDSSFEGYGEGFVDDEAQETGYSTTEGDDRAGSRKRPKKVCICYSCCVSWLTNNKSSQGHGFQGAPMRQNSYGPGMVGA